MRRHRPRENAANVSMVGARCDIEDNVFVTERWSDDGDVRQMSSSKHGMVGYEYVSSLQLAFPNLGLLSDTG